MTQSKNSVHVVAPTGNAAYNVGGETIHKFFSCNDSEKLRQLTDQTKEILLKQLQCTLCVIFDERSLISSALLAQAEDHIKTFIYGGINKHEEDISWGGIPIILLVGDDKQLPLIGRGAFSTQFKTTIQDKANGYKNAKIVGERYKPRGLYLFWEAGQHVMNLSVIERTNKNQMKFKEMLQNSRDNKPDTHDVKELQRYHIDFSKVIPDEYKEQIEKEAVHLFAKKSQEMNIMPRNFKTYRKRTILLHL